VRHRAQHLHDDRLFDCYLAVRDGDTLDPPVAEHLIDCDACSERYNELILFMDGLKHEASAETDAIFTPDRLRAQRQHIDRRLDHLGHPAHVITFPGRAVGHPVASVVRPARRWIAAAAAAGLFIGVGTGLFFDWEGVRRPGRRATQLARQTLLTAPFGSAQGQPTSPLEAARPEPDDADVVDFLSEIEQAGARPRIRELLAVDALTPHVREINLR
jgi:hypothetical protein